MDAVMPRGPRSSQPNWQGPRPLPGGPSFQYPYGFQQPSFMEQPPGYPPPYAYSQRPPRTRDGIPAGRQRQRTVWSRLAAVLRRGRPPA